MPSSHMTVMGAYSSFYIFHGETTKMLKVFYLLLIIIQGMARIELNYHTLAQVIAGVVFSVLYERIFYM